MSDTTTPGTTPETRKGRRGRADRLPVWRMGLTGGLVGMLCGVGPTVLALLGIVSAGTAFVWATNLYDNYAWRFRLGGLTALLLLVWLSLRRRNQCSAVGVRRWRWRLLGVARHRRGHLCNVVRDDDLAGYVCMTTEKTNAETVIQFYWRPGCPFCMVLRSRLRRSGLPVQEVNIWQDPRAAARVRSVAGGNETVPTVFVGSHAMVNPGMGQVLAAVRDHTPDLAADATPKAQTPAMA